MKRFVFDASIAIKWFFDEVDSGKALKLQSKLKNGLIKVCVPQIFFFEVIKVIKTKPVSTSQDVNRVVGVIFDLPFVSRKADKELLKNANFYAQKYNLTIYDASYIALAKTIRVNLITADDKLRDKVKLGFVKSLKNIKI